MCDDSLATRRFPRPRWSRLYAIAGLALALLALVEAFAARDGWRAAGGAIVALAAFAAMAAWARANRVALDLAAWCDCAGSQTTIRVVHSHIADATARQAGTVTPWNSGVGIPPGRRTRAPSRS